jgi:hypothetical protein
MYIQAMKGTPFTSSNCSNDSKYLIPGQGPGLVIPHVSLANRQQHSLGAVVQFHALLQAVGDGALAGSGALGKGGRATEGTGRGAVADADNADVVDAGDGGIAGHTLGHLDFEREVGVGGQGEALHTEPRDVLCDFSGLERVGLRATRGAVDCGLQRTGTVLVDLAVCHCDGAVIGAGGETLGRAEAGGRGDVGLRWTAGLGPAAAYQPGNAGGAACTAAKEVGELAGDPVAALGVVLGDVVFLSDAGGCAGVGRGCASAHEGGNHGLGFDGPVTLGSAEGSDFAGGDLPVTDNGCVGLGAASVGGAVSRGTIGD